MLETVERPAIERIPASYTDTDSALEIARLEAQFDMPSAPESDVPEGYSPQETPADETLQASGRPMPGLFEKAGNFLFGTRLGKAATAAVVSLSVATAYSLATPDKAHAETVCTTSPGGDSTKCTTTPDTPPSEGNDSSPDSPDKPDKPHQQEPVHAPKTDDTNSQINFRGYNMEDSWFTDHNGCFITGAASALRRETGNAHIRPRSIYFPSLQSRWSPGGGVVGGKFLFDALPSMAAHFNVRVHTVGFKGALKAVRNGHQVMMLATPPSHFTYGGHYLDARAATRSGRLILDDPNGKGLHGDSERPGGWSGAELQNAGITDYRTLVLDK